MTDLAAMSADQLAEKVADLENREWAASCTPSRYGEGFEDALREAMPILREAMRRASERDQAVNTVMAERLRAREAEKAVGDYRAGCCLDESCGAATEARRLRDALEPLVAAATGLRHEHMPEPDTSDSEADWTGRHMPGCQGCAFIAALDAARSALAAGGGEAAT